MEDSSKNIGKITSAFGKTGIVEPTDGGRLYFLVKSRKLKPVVGDNVHWNKQSDGTIVVTKIMEPNNQLERLNQYGQQQIIASNITQILLITAPLPKPNFLLIDKFILISELMECNLSIILNKVDLVEKSDRQFQLYQQLGYPVIKISAKKKINLNPLFNLLHQQTTVLVGQSGVGKSTPQEAIKKAYRKSALKYHPDRNKGDKAAEEKFKEASEAYHVLSDKERRQNYDQFGHAAFDGAGGRGGFANSDFTSTFSDIFGSDIFDDFFDGFGGGKRSGRRRQSENRGADLRYDLTISLEDAYSVKKQEIKYSSSEKCDRCNGHGSEPGSSPSECSACGGHGQVRSNQGFFTVQQTCPQCGGSGEEISNPCKNCKGIGKKQTYKKLSVTIPKGVDDGTRIRLSGKGEAGVKGSSNGDLYIFINVNSHDIFKRSEENLFFEFPISLADAALGTTIEVPTIDGGRAKVKIPAGTQNGKQFRLKGKGMSMMRNRNYGDLYIRVITEVPVSLTKEQKNLLEQFKKLEDTKTNPIMKDFFEKAKRFWKN